MRVAPALCALLVVVSSIPVIAAAGQRERLIAPARNPALPPEPPPPLYFPPLYNVRPLTVTLSSVGEPQAAAPHNPALPPAPPGPLYFPDRFRTLRPGDALFPANSRRSDGEVVLRQTKPDEGFKPISELPPEEKLPAGPMLVGAYVFVVLALFAYVLSLARRVNAVGRDLARIDAQLKRR
jgi:hypothetical protein